MFRSFLKYGMILLMADPEQPPASPTQLDKFKEAARALECDDDEARFDERVKRIVKPIKPDSPLGIEPWHN